MHPTRGPALYGIEIIKAERDCPRLTTRRMTWRPIKLE